jgi:hypothetical protein
MATPGTSPPTPPEGPDGPLLACRPIRLDCDDPGMSALLTEPSRQAAHGLLDTVVSLDEDHDVIALAFSRLNEVAPLTLRIDEATGHPAAWGQDIMLAVLFTTEILLNSVEKLSGRTREEVVFLVRGMLDGDA